MQLPPSPSVQPHGCWNCLHIRVLHDDCILYRHKRVENYFAAYIANYGERVGGLGSGVVLQAVGHLSKMVGAKYKSKTAARCCILSLITSGRADQQRQTDRGLEGGHIGRCTKSLTTPSPRALRINAFEKKGLITMKAKKRGKITYNSRYSLVVTDPTTDQPLSGLTMGERTGSRIFHWVWSYVSFRPSKYIYKGCCNLNQLRWMPSTKSPRPR